MYNTNKIYDFLKKDGSKNFEVIWEKFKDNFITEDITKAEETNAKTRLYMSIMEDSNIILNPDGEWDIKENYTLKQIKESESLVFKDAIMDIEPEETEEIELSNLNTEE